MPLALLHGAGTAAAVALHTLIGEFVPFIILLGTLYMVAGGIYIRGNLHGTPLLNTAILAIGGVLASFMGTTGAAMLLIRPLIRANDNRKRSVHTIVFFIFIVANIGGSLTPLGDPPLFLGFLKGVTSSGPCSTCPCRCCSRLVVLLALYYAIDTVLYRRDCAEGLQRDPTPDAPLRIEGGVNLPAAGARDRRGARERAVEAGHRTGRARPACAARGCAARCRLPRDRWRLAGADREVDARGQRVRLGPDRSKSPSSSSASSSPWRRCC